MSRSSAQVNFTPDSDNSQNQVNFTPDQNPSILQGITSGVQDVINLPSEIGYGVLGSIAQGIGSPGSVLPDVYQNMRATIQNKLLPTALSGVKAAVSPAMDIANKLGALSPKDKNRYNNLSNIVPQYSPKDTQSPVSKVASILPYLYPGELGANAGAKAYDIASSLGKTGLTDLLKTKIGNTTIGKLISKSSGALDAGAKIASAGAGSSVATGQNPVEGATSGLLGNLALRGAGTLVRPQGAMRNLALEVANRTGTIAPEEVNNQLQGQFIQPGTPVGLGTATGSPLLQWAQGVTENMPGSMGTTMGKNVVKGQIKGANAVSNALGEQLKSMDNDKLSLENELADNSNTASSAINSVENSPLPVDSEAQNAVNNLTRNIPQGVMSSEHVVNGAQKYHKAARDTAAAMYDRFDPTKGDIGQISLASLSSENPKDMLPSYSSAARDQKVDEINLDNTWGNSDDLKGSIKKEMRKALNVANDGSDSPINLGEAVDRSKNLALLARKAYASGDGETGKRLSSLKNGLDSDIDNLMNKNGLSKESDVLRQANNIWANHVVPFRSTPNLNKATSGKGIFAPQSVANELLKSGNEDILSKLPQDVQDAALFNKLHGGSSPTNNRTSLPASSLSDKYNKMSDDYKISLRNRNPNLHAYFESLPNKIASDKANKINTVNNLNTYLKDYSTQNKTATNAINQSQDIVKNAKKLIDKNISRLDAPSAKLTSSDILKKVASLATLIPGVSLTYGRALTNALHDPEVLKAYTGREPNKFNIVPKKISGNTAKISSLLNAINTMGSNQ